MSKKSKKTGPKTRIIFAPPKEYTAPSGNNVLRFSYTWNDYEGCAGEVGYTEEVWLEWWPERDGNQPGACFSPNLPELIKFLLKSYDESNNA